MRVQQLRWFAVLKSQEWRSGTIQDRLNTTSQFDPWLWSPENNVLACVRVVKRLPSNEAVPSREHEPF
eukprot:36598-Pyramimonas_sp.AAC.1